MFTCSSIRFPLNLVQLLSFIVLIAVFCYPADICAHPQKFTSAHPDPLVERMTIELSQVDNLNSVARFTRLLSENPQLNDLQLVRVVLQVDCPERSLVSWSARLVSGTPDELQQWLLAAADADDALGLVYRRSYRGFLGFALNAAFEKDVDAGDFIPALHRSTWPVRSGHGFD